MVFFIFLLVNFRLSTHHYYGNKSLGIQIEIKAHLKGRTCVTFFVITSTIIGKSSQIINSWTYGIGNGIQFELIYYTDVNA